MNRRQTLGGNDVVADDCAALRTFGPIFSGIYSRLKAYRNLRENNTGYYSVINSTPNVAKAMSSLEERPLTATAPTTSPFFHTGMPPPHPTYLGSP